MAVAVSFSSYLGGNSDERCGVCAISEDGGAPEIVYMVTCSLSEAAPWPSGVGVLLKGESGWGRGERESNTP